MLTIVALCARAALLSAAADVRPFTAAELRTDWQGGFRHVQLLEVRAGDPAVAVLATAFMARDSRRPGGEACLALYELTFADSAAAPDPEQARSSLSYPYKSKDVELPVSSIDDLAPFATLQCGGHLLPFTTWWNGPAWRVVQFGDQHVGVMHDPASRTVVVQRFLTREPWLVVEDCGALWDVALQGTDLCMLIARPGELVLVRFDLGSRAEPHRVRRLCEDDGRATAAFVVGAEGALLVARATKTGLEITEFTVGDTSRTTTVIAVDRPAPNGIGRIAAREVNGAVAVMVDVYEGSCVLLVPQLGQEARAHDICSMGRTPTRRRRVSQGDSGYKHALAVLSDLDHDGVPEVLVTDSESVLSEHVELSSGRTGALLDVRFNPGMRFGSSLGVTADGRYAVAAGGRASMPEFLDSPAEAVLMRIDGGATPALVPVARWRCQREGEQPR